MDSLAKLTTKNSAKPRLDGEGNEDEDNRKNIVVVFAIRSHWQKPPQYCKVISLQLK